MPKVYRQDDDARLIKRCLKGDEKAFAEVFNKYRDVAYRVAFRYLGNQEDALDAVYEGRQPAKPRNEKFKCGKGVECGGTGLLCG